MPCPNSFSTNNFPAVYNTYVCYYATNFNENFAQAKSFCNNLYSPRSSLIRIKTTQERSYASNFAAARGAIYLWVCF